MNFYDELVNTIQSVGIAYSVWRGPAATLADVLAKAMATPGRLDEIRRLLHSQPLRAALSTRDIGLWTGHDGQLRLVDQQPSSFKAAVLRTQHHPGAGACRYCLMAEPMRLEPELEPERDARGDTVPGSFVHKQCATAWTRLRAQVASREAGNG